MARKLDVAVADHGTVWSLTPITPAATAWAEEHLPEDAPTLGDRFIIEHRYIGPIVEGMRNDGLNVEVSGRG